MAMALAIAIANAATANPTKVTTAPKEPMPYSAQHKQLTRERITEAARVLFNRYGFEAVSIDMVMEEVGLTRGGFYNHFRTKDALYQAAVESFLHGRGAEWRKAAGLDNAADTAEQAYASKRMVDSYLSGDHLGDLDGQCPMIALPSDIARAGPEMQSAYQELLEAMVGLFEQDLSRVATTAASARSRALAMASLCIGGMVVARTLPDSELADEVREAALTSVRELIQA